VRPIPLTRSGGLVRRSRPHPAFARFAAPGTIPLVVLLLAFLPGSAPGQTTGRIQGSVIDLSTGEPLADVLIRVEALDRSTLTSEAGRFVLAGLPSGRHDVRVELVGYKFLDLESVAVRAGRASELAVQLEPTAVAVEPIRVEADRLPLIEPEVSETRQLVPGTVLRELPVTTVEQAVELTTGVSDGHFRGGRVGQETYLVDGMAIKNQVEGATEGQGLRFSPTALSEIEVITGGFGAEYGASLSGVVSYTTRRGDPNRWNGAAFLLTDRLSPESASVGQTTFNISGGGPLPFLGSGATLFADLQLQGLQDAEPRARGLTCIQPDEADADVAAAINAYQSSTVTAPLYCPYQQEGLPYQQGDGLIGFLRLDKPFSGRLNVAATLLRNRFQRELYTPELKYNDESQLARSTEAWLGTLILDHVTQQNGQALSFTARIALQRLDRYLGVVDPAEVSGRSTVLGFGFSDFQFAGEDFVRLPIEQQLDSTVAVPGYRVPGGLSGSPFGAASENIFTTSGTSGLAAYSRSDFLGTDLVGELITASGSAYQAGFQGKFYRVQTYERTRAYLAGSAPNYARFYPTTLAGFVDASIRPDPLFTLSAGFRVEGFQAGLDFSQNRSDFLAPVVSTDWKVNATPRVGMAGAFDNSAGRSAFRFNYARVAQPPDFQFFIDNTIGDSLRTDVRRQGNPNLAFEQGNAFEMGVSQLFGDVVSLDVTAYLKNLTDLVTGNVALGGSAPGQFTTGDKGTVKGIEITARGRWRGFVLRAGYALAEATGITSGAFDDSGPVPVGATQEYPLAFDRRHTIDGALLVGRAAAAGVGPAMGGGGLADSPVGLAVTARIRSGYPIETGTPEDPADPPPQVERLPWTSVFDARFTWDFARIPGCGGCVTRLVLDARNVFGEDNVIALRRDSGNLSPTLGTILGMSDAPATSTFPIPRESERYAPLADLDGNGRITGTEFETARFAAALDASDPSLLFGEPRQLRIGLEVVF
jgi:hypothetical protein